MAITKIRNSQLAIMTDFDINSHKLTNVTAGTNANDAVNFTQLGAVSTAVANLDTKLEGLAVGLVPHAAVQAIQSAELTGYTMDGTNKIMTASTNVALPASFDGATLLGGDMSRVLICLQGGTLNTPDVDNGIYTVTSLGEEGVSPWVLTRAADFDAFSADEIKTGAYVYATKGSDYKNMGYGLLTPIDFETAALGTTALVFGMINNIVNPTIIAGDGIDVTDGVNGSVTIAADLATADGTNGGRGGLVMVTEDTDQKIGVNVDGSSIKINTSGQIYVDSSVGAYTGGDAITISGGAVTVDYALNNGLALTTDGSGGAKQLAISMLELVTNNIEYAVGNMPNGTDQVITLTGKAASFLSMSDERFVKVWLNGQLLDIDHADFTLAAKAEPNQADAALTIVGTYTADDRYRIEWVKQGVSVVAEA